MASSNVCWGIDVGYGAITALKLERDGDQVKIADFVVVPHKKVLSTPDIDQADATRLALGALMSQYGHSMKNASIAVSVPGHSAFARFAKLPPVEAKGVPNLVRFEAVQQIPFPIEEVEWDYQVFASDNSPDIEVGIFAITKERVGELLSLYADANLQPSIINLSPVAAYNAIAYDLAFTEQTPGTIILDIGTVATDLIVAEQGKVWVRTFPLGGHNFTEALAETFKLNYSKAEKLKREAETSKYRRHIFQALKPVLTDLVQDVQRSISYYEDTHPDAKIERLIGLGSTFKLAGLRKLLSQQLKIDVFRLERFKRISVEGPGAADFEASTVNMATAYGLALQGLGMVPINANLMPVQVIRESLWKSKTPWFMAAAGLLLAGAGVTYLRPFLDSSQITPLSSDSTIASTIRFGKEQKNRWQEVQSQNQPRFMAENVRRLLDNRELYTFFLADLDQIFAYTNAQAPDDLMSDSQGFALELKQFETQYLAPGAPLAGGRPASGGSGGSGGDLDPFNDPFAGNPRERGGTPSPPAPEEQPSGEAQDDSKAGQYGAVAITLVVDAAPENARTFINETVLQWLREHRERQDVPYRIVAPPKIDEITMQVIRRAEGGQPETQRPGLPSRPEQSAPQPTRTRPRSTPADEAAPSVGFGGGGSPQQQQPQDGGFQKPGSMPGSGGGTGFDERPGRPGAGPAGPSGPRGNTQDLGEIDDLAPLPAPPPRFDPERDVVRYFITWSAQLERPAAAGRTEQNSGAVGDADGETSA